MSFLARQIVSLQCNCIAQLSRCMNAGGDALVEACSGVKGGGDGGAVRSEGSRWRAQLKPQGIM